MENLVHIYNGNEIRFRESKENVMVNATQMAKAFDKRTSDWLRTEYANEFIQELTVARKCVTADLVIVKQGGNIQGTWFHEDVALEFARWLSPAFAIWCNDKIKELLKTGHAEIVTEDDAILRAMNILQERTKKQSEQLRIQAPKVAYHDEVLQSVSTYKTNQIAKELGMSARSLNVRLHDEGIQYKQAGTWLLYHKYQNKGYTKTETYSYTNAEGHVMTSMQTVWTEHGRKFIHDIIKSLQSA